MIQNLNEEEKLKLKQNELNLLLTKHKSITCKRLEQKIDNIKDKDEEIIKLIKELNQEYILILRIYLI